MTHTITWPRKLALPLVLGFGAPIALGSAGLAQAPEPVPEQATGTPDTKKQKAEARVTRRVIRLADGRVLRARARRDGELWFVQLGERWSSIPAAEVAAVTTEASLLREAKQRSHKVRLGDAEGHYAVADWMEKEGLRKEAVRKLDTVFKYDPDHGDAHAMLERIPITVQYPPLEVAPNEAPEAIQKLLNYAGKMPPTAREVIVEYLGEQENLRDPIVEALGADLTHPDKGRRSFAALALRRQYPGEHVLRLVARAVLDVDDGVRRDAAFCLRDMKEPGLIAPVLKAMDSDNPLVRMNADDALGNMGYAAAVEPLMTNLVALSKPQSSGGGRAPGGFIFTGLQVAYVSDFDVEIAQAASIADPQISVIQSATMLEARSHGVSGYTIVTHRKVVRRALEKVTGEKPGDRVSQWQSWWEKNRDRYPTQDVEQAPDASLEDRTASR